jgi:hypothetical protein
VAAAGSTPGTGLAPYFRRYELPWSPGEDMERRFRAILRNLAIVSTLIAIVIALLPKQEPVTNTAALPERIVKLVMEPPPPPPPPPKPEVRPLAKAPVSTAAPEARPVDPRAKAAKSGLLANLDDLAALNNVDLDKLAKTQKQTTNAADVSPVTGDLSTMAAGGTSGGIAVAKLSNGLAPGSGSLKGHQAAQVSGPALAAAKASVQGGGSGKASRSSEELALVFTKNKGAIDMLYMRALRDNPALQGKMVVELTIAPSGAVTAVRIVSDDLNDPEFEEKLKARIASFKFDAKDVAQMIATRTIDFFPAG